MSVAQSSRGSLCFAWAVVVGVVLLVYARLFFGVDFTDESFYVGLPWAYLLGHRPIADELAVQQFSGLPLVPFVEIYVELTGGRDGLVLFVRHLYFAGSLVAAWLVLRYFGALFGRVVGLLLAAFSVAFVPYGIPSISYNTEAGLGLLSGFLLLASAARARHPARSSFAGALVLLTAGFAYPTLTLVGIAAIVASLAHQWQERRLAFARSATACLVAVLAWATQVLWLIKRYGSDDAYRSMYEHHTSLGIQGGGFGKVVSLVEQLLWVAWFLLALAIVFGVVALVIRSRHATPLMIVALALVGPALWLVSGIYRPQRAPHATTDFALAALAALAIVLLVRLRRGDGPGPRRELVGIVVGALLASGCIAWSSANGLRATGAGLLPAALVGLALLSVLPRRPATSRFAALMASLVAFELAGLYVYIYRDAPLLELDTRVPRGAFAGLRTTADRVRFIERLDEDLAVAARTADSVLVFDYFPAGYLFTELVPNTPSIWMFPLHGFTGNPEIRDLYARDLAGREDLPDLVVVMKIIPLVRPKRLSTLDDGDAVLALLRERGYAEVLERPEYVFFRAPRAL